MVVFPHSPGASICIFLFSGWTSSRVARHLRIRIPSKSNHTDLEESYATVSDNNVIAARDDR